MQLLKSKGLTQSGFAQKLSERWLPTTGRKISTQAVNEWANGAARPNLEPIELLILLQILDCSLEEFVLALEEIPKKSTKTPEVSRSRSKTRSKKVAAS
jgi:transcriptional regulator with XRE-family HTH domain